MKIEVDKYDMHRMILLLDAADDALTVAAKIEKRQQQNEPIRQITAQERAEATRLMVDEMMAKYL